MARFTYSPECVDPECWYIQLVGIEYDYIGDSVGGHEHPWGHWSVVCFGTIEYKIGDKIFDVSDLGQVWIPKNTKHSMRSKTEKSRSLCVVPGKVI